MSIADKLSRLSDARDDIITSLGNKGVSATGHGFEDFPDDIDSITTGSGSAVVVTDTLDSHGGTIREITAVSLAGITVRADVLGQGYTAINALGETVNGTAVIGGGGGSPVLQTKTKTYTPSETQQTETVTADSGYDGLEEVDITVNAISPTYVGSGITRRDDTDLTASGATVTVPAGYYEDQETKSVASGSVTAPASISGTSATVSTGTNTLTLTKSVSVTPNVSTPGYISSGTAGNSSVSLTASVNTRSSSDLTASGATVTAPAGYYAQQATKTISSGTAGTPTATKGTVSNHSVSITPSVTNTTGYITGSTKTGAAVTVSASELVSGSETKTANGTYDVTNLASLVVNVPTGGGSVSVETKTTTLSSTASSISFTGLSGTPKYWFLRTTAQISSSGSTTYYYVIDARYNGTNTTGNSFRIGSTRRIYNVTSGLSYTYSNGTITISSSSANTASPGYFYNGAYELINIY